MLNICEFVPFEAFNTEEEPTEETVEEITETPRAVTSSVAPEDKKPAGYKGSTSKDGCYSGRLDPVAAAALTAYCKELNLPRNKILAEAVLEYVENHQDDIRNKYRNMSQDELIDIIIAQRAQNQNGGQQ